MSKYVSPISQNIFSKGNAGSMYIEAGAPTEVPQSMVSDALVRGCLMYEPEKQIEKPIEEEVQVTETETEAEEVVEVDEPEVDDLQGAIADVMARNKEADFTGAGRPRVAPLAELVGRTLTVKEVEAAWATYESN
jgi:hypothetical protein